MTRRRCFLNDFPSGYKLFKQTKDGRTDHYLIGTTVRSHLLACFLIWSSFFVRVEIRRRLQITSGILPPCMVAYERVSHEA